MEPRSFWDSNPKTTFFTGLFLGIAASSILALLAMLSILMSGNLAVGAGKVAANVPAVVQPGAIDPSQQAPAAGPVAEVTDKDHIKGPKDAKVTLVEYSDFQCAYCNRHEPTVAQILKDFPKDVRLVYRHYPLSFHQNAVKAAEASECANKLGGSDAFWAMHEKLFANNDALNGNIAADFYEKLAAENKLDVAKFKTCLDSGEMNSIVTNDTTTGNNAGVEGTPATFVNGKLVSGAVPYATFKAAVQAAGAQN